jgi:hypothetical protein
LQPFAVPFTTANVTAPVPDPPLVLSRRVLPYVPLTEVTLRGLCWVPTTILAESMTLNPSPENRREY